MIIAVDVGTGNEGEGWADENEGEDEDQCFYKRPNYGMTSCRRMIGCDITCTRASEARLVSKFTCRI